MPDEKEDYKPKSFMLRDIPEDIYLYLLKRQAEEKAKCKCQKGIPTIVYSIIRKEIEPSK